jgi:hypothetical protein
MWSSNFILGPRSNSAHIQPENGLQDASNCARHLFGESTQRRQVSRTWPPCILLAAACRELGHWGATERLPSVSLPPYPAVLPIRFVAPSVPRAERGRVHHGRRSGAPSSAVALPPLAATVRQTATAWSFFILPRALSAVFPTTLSPECATAVAAIAGRAP